MGLEQEIGELLRRKRLTLGTVESATGGLVAHMITNVVGSSEYFQGSIVSYSNDIKMKLVGVDPETLGRYGAVSEQVAGQMAAGGAKVLGVDICIADTGIAGPGGATPGKPIGLFYFGLYYSGKVHTQRRIFQGDRQENKETAAWSALIWLRDYLAGLK